MHSADIITYDPATETFLAVDCTTSVPDIEKISKIRDTADYLAEKTKHHIIPVIFSSVNCPSIKREQAERENVFIIGVRESGSLCDLLLKDRSSSSVRAKELFHKLIKTRRVFGMD